MSASKVCVVVGLGGGGIGDHVAKKFSEEGYKVAMVARSNLEALEKDIPNSKSYQCDTTKHEQIVKVVETILSDMGGKIHVLIYNVGVGYFKKFEDTSRDEFELCMQAGPMGLFSFVKCVLPAMERGGVIGTTGATASWRGMPITPAFAPSKFAVRALMQALARDLGPSKGIHVFHVIIDGIVAKHGTKERFPGKPDNELLDPKTIADTYWHLAQQPETCWSQEVNVAPSGAFGSIASI